MRPAPRNQELGTLGPEIQDPLQSLKLGPGTPQKFKSGTPGAPSKFKSGTLGAPSKFKSGTPSVFFNELIFFENISSFLFFFTFFLCLF